MTKQELEKQLEEARDKVASLEIELKDFEKWEMQPADWQITGIGTIGKLKFDITTLSQIFGIRRHSKEQCEIDAPKMERRNLLEYWAGVTDPLWIDQDIPHKAWCILRAHDGTYCAFYHNTARFEGTIYMSEKAAIEICDALNNGDLTLGENNE